MAADAAHAPDHQPEAKIFIFLFAQGMAFADRLDAALTRCELRIRRHQKGGLRCPTA
jgi:hypothetical protein